MIEDSTLFARSAVFETLVMGLTSKGEMDDKSKVEFIRRCLVAHAWAVREEYVANLALSLAEKQTMLTPDMMREAAATFRTTRREAVTALHDFALFQALAQTVETHETRQ